jgi:dTMP kinase
MFIVLEGIDGCGKSTQAKMLCQWLRGEGKKVLLTAEPTRNEIGQFIRKVLSGSHEVDPKTLALLFTADRYEHLRNEVLPALKERKIVLSERYYPSTIAYQEAQGVPREWLVEINKFARKPDLVIFLDVEPEGGVARTETGEIFEEVKFLKKVRKNYLEFDDVIRIDANKSRELIFGEIKNKLADLI